MRRFYPQLQARHIDTALADDLLEASKMNPNADEQSLLKVSSRSMRVHEKQGKTNEMISLEGGIAHLLYITEYRAWAQTYSDKDSRAIILLTVLRQKCLCTSDLPPKLSNNTAEY